MADTPRELEKGDITRHMLYLGIPLLIVNLMQNLFSIFDMFLVGRLGVHSLSAIAVIGFIFSTFWSITGGLMAGAVAITSRCCGKKDYDTLKKAIVHTLFTAYLVTAVYVVISYIFRDNLLIYFGAKGETLELGRYIFQTYLISILNDSGLFVFLAILRATGNINRHFYLVVISVALNTLFEPLFIFGWLGLPKLGLMGAPLARFISYFVTTCIMASILTSTGGILKIKRENLKLDPVFLWNYIKLSVPAILQGIVPSIASLTLLKVASRGGDALLAALGIGSRLDNVVMMICYAAAGSVTIMVGHNLGAGHTKRAEESVITGLKITTAFTLACFLIYFNFSDIVIRIFNSDVSVVNYGSWYLRIVSFFYLLMGVGIITSNTFNGAGDTKSPMIINMLAYLLFQIPLALFLYNIPAIGSKSVFIGIASVYAFQGIAGWVVYKRGNWKHKVL